MVTVFLLPKLRGMMGLTIMLGLLGEIKGNNVFYH
jgi:hypothetical protein